MPGDGSTLVFRKYKSTNWQFKLKVLKIEIKKQLNYPIFNFSSFSFDRDKDRERGGSRRQERDRSILRSKID